MEDIIKNIVGLEFSIMKFDLGDIAVIGNIHDNPDLLTTKTE